jgi:hypothetical protein
VKRCGGLEAVGEVFERRGQCQGATAQVPLKLAVSRRGNAGYCSLSHDYSDMLRTSWQGSHCRQLHAPTTVSRKPLGPAPAWGRCRHNDNLGASRQSC